MHIAEVMELEEHLLPHTETLAAAIGPKANEWMDVVKNRAPHLMDAVSLTVGQEWSGWAHQIRDALARVRGSEAGLFELAAGGTAVGTGVNAPPNFGREIAEKIAGLTGYLFVTAPNRFAAQGSLDAMVAAIASVRGLAVALMKIANDMRWLGSGPRCGLSELLLPENKPGLVDHAGRGQSDPAGGGGVGLHPGDRGGQCARLCRQPGEFRAQCDAPNHHQ
jgi:fumarate hydratase class II